MTIIFQWQKNFFSTLHLQNRGLLDSKKKSEGSLYNPVWTRFTVKQRRKVVSGVQCSPCMCQSLPKDTQLTVILVATWRENWVVRRRFFSRESFKAFDFHAMGFYYLFKE